MATVVCQNCSKPTQIAGFAAWQIVVSILLFPLGLLALMGGRKPTICMHCSKLVRT